MAGWCHRLDRHEFEWTPGVCDGQGGLACYDSWGRKESDTTERLNWTEWIKYEMRILWVLSQKSHLNHLFPRSKFTGYWTSQTDYELSQDRDYNLFIFIH